MTITRETFGRNQPTRKLTMKEIMRLKTDRYHQTYLDHDDKPIKDLWQLISDSIDRIYNHIHQTKIIE